MYFNSCVSQNESKYVCMTYCISILMVLRSSFNCRISMFSDLLLAPSNFLSKHETSRLDITVYGYS